MFGQVFDSDVECFLRVTNFYLFYSDKRLLKGLLALLLIGSSTERWVCIGLWSLLITPFNSLSGRISSAVYIFHNAL